MKKEHERKNIYKKTNILKNPKRCKRKKKHENDTKRNCEKNIYEEKYRRWT